MSDPKPDPDPKADKSEEKKTDDEKDKDKKSSTMATLWSTMSKSKKQQVTQTSYEQPKETIGLLVTEQLETAIARCREQVETLAGICRARNQKFRDQDFDLENDMYTCLNGLGGGDEAYSPAGILRVTEIFESPVFFKDGATSSDIAQGGVGDCWFLAALAIVASVPGLIERICVAQDQEVGIYGFIFFRDGMWQDVVIDDQLCVTTSPYDEAEYDKKSIYHYDRELYDSIARRGRRILYFGRSREENETWVSLLEKAYAKFYGSYSNISGGWTSEGIEDLTGGVSHLQSVVDVLNRDRLWTELVEYTHEKNKTRTYACAKMGWGWTTQDNIVYNHAYSILRAVEYKEKKFLVIRNPWGQYEWTGPWSDGSKEWTKEWLPALDALDHKFGNDGQFVMEYKDFLKNWGLIDGAHLFDSSWKVSNIWVELTNLNAMHVAAWGHISFTISVEKATPALIVLQRVDQRSFDDIASPLWIDFDFVVFKKGSPKQYASSIRRNRYHRGRNTEVDLEPGEYVVHVRLDAIQRRPNDYVETSIESWDDRVFCQMLARKKKAFSIALNYSKDDKNKDEAIPVELDEIAGYDLTEVELKLVEAKREAEAKKKAEKKAAAEETKKFNEAKRRAAAAAAAAAAPKIVELPTTTTAATESKPDATTTNGAAIQPAETKAVTESKPEETKPAETKPEEVKSEETKSQETKPEEAKAEECKPAEEKPAATESAEAKPEEAKAEETKPAEGESKTEEAKAEGSKNEEAKAEEAKAGDAPKEEAKPGESKPEDAKATETKPEAAKTEEPKPAEVAVVEPAVVEVKPPSYTHMNTVCKTCRTSPIVGVLFRCTDAACIDFDLCTTCFVKQEHDVTHEMKAIVAPRQVIHKNEVCSSCAKTPIVGTLYKCMKKGCTSNLCQACQDKKEHALHHPVLVVTTVEEDEEESNIPKHEGIICDHCGMDPIVGPRFKCMDSSCPNFDLCESCHSKGVHNIKHNMLRLNTAEEAQYLTASVAGGSDLVLGLRVYTKLDAPAILSAQLKHWGPPKVETPAAETTDAEKKDDDKKDDKKDDDDKKKDQKDGADDSSSSEETDSDSESSDESVQAQPSVPSKTVGRSAPPPIGTRVPSMGGRQKW
ncbi:hypothetical protein FRB91_011448 [Serendipita sp. 411]|nr:hypothetical protein FRB91_011448 [Serendipita sp. 411]